MITYPAQNPVFSIDTDIQEGHLKASDTSYLALGILHRSRHEAGLLPEIMNVKMPRGETFTLPRFSDFT